MKPDKILYSKMVQKAVFTQTRFFPSFQIIINTFNPFKGLAEILQMPSDSNLTMNL
jgi:hypothetical protein